MPRAVGFDGRSKVVRLVFGPPRHDEDEENALTRISRMVRGSFDAIAVANDLRFPSVDRERGDGWA